MDSKSAKEVAEATINLLLLYSTHPYNFWELGANDNANGLPRQYITKGSNIREVVDDVISLAMARINYRPKKCLGFKQPAIIFQEMCLAD